MGIIQRVPWRVQPKTAVGIDRNNAITQGLVAVACPGLFRESLLSGTIAKVARSRGVSYFGTMRFEVGESYSLSNPHTAFTLFRTEGTVSALAVHTSHSSAGTSFWMGQGNAGEMYISAGGLANAGTYSLGRDYAIAGVFSGATVYEYVDGVQAATASNSTSGSGKLVLMALGAGGFSCLGSVALSMAFNRALSAGEIASLSQNPWQLFAPLPRRIWAPAASGGGTSIAGALGTAVASGLTGNVNANRTIAGTLGTAVASGFTGTVSNSTDTTITGALGTAVASGFTGGVNANRTIAGALGTATASGFQGTVTNDNSTTITGNVGIAVASGFTGGVSWNRYIVGVLGVATASGFTGGVQNGEAVAPGGGGWLPKMRRKTRKELHAERVRLGILPPDVVKAAKKAAAVVLDEPSPVKAYKADPEAANKVFLRELGATNMLPDYTRAIKIQIEIMQQEEEEILLLL